LVKASIADLMQSRRDKTLSSSFVKFNSIFCRGIFFANRPLGLSHGIHQMSRFVPAESASITSIISNLHIHSQISSPISIAQPDFKDEHTPISPVLSLQMPISENQLSKSQSISDGSMNDSKNDLTIGQQLDPRSDRSYQKILELVLEPIFVSRLFPSVSELHTNPFLEHGFKYSEWYEEKESKSPLKIFDDYSLLDEHRYDNIYERFGAEILFLNRFFIILSIIFILLFFILIRVFSNIHHCIYLFYDADHYPVFVCTFNEIGTPDIG
jgi:hypothetical protein